MSSKVSQMSSLYNSRNFDQTGGITGAIDQETKELDALAADKISVTMTFNLGK